MIRKILMTAAAFLAIVSGSVQAAAFLHIESIPGTSQDPEHQGWIDILSFSLLGQTNGVEFGVLKVLDNSSPKLAEAVSRGKVFPTVLLDQQTSTGLFRTTMTNVIIASYNVSGAGQSNELPAENFTLKAESATSGPVGGKSNKGKRDENTRAPNENTRLKKEREPKTR